MSRENKALIVFLIDQSEAMQDTFGTTSHRKMDAIALAVNRFLQKMILRATGREGVKDCLDIGLFGYGSEICPLFGGPLAGRTLVSLSEVDANARMELQKRSFIDEVTGESIETEIEVPVWIEPKADGTRRQCAVLRRALGIVEPWIDEHPQSFPPLIIHIANGESTDGDPLPNADVLKQLETEDGNVLLLTCLLATNKADGSILFPLDDEALPDPTWKKLFQMSSVLPDQIRQVTEVDGVRPESGARGFALLSDMLGLTGFLDLASPKEMGTRAPSSPESDPGPPARPDPVANSASSAKVHENVQFTVYRPKSIPPESWRTLLAFAHLDERPPEAPPDESDPIQQVKRLAERELGREIRDYQDTTQDSLDAIPHEAEMTFVPEIEGVEFNPSRQSIRFIESVHKVPFRMRAGADRDGQTLRGRFSVFLGPILLADVPLRVKVDSVQTETEPAEPVPLRRYRKIFASYSHRDLAIVRHLETYAETLGDRYLRDWKDLRSGENWDERLLEMIEEADVFQLFWSSNAMRSPYCRREWEHALSLGRPAFIRPTYWEDPLPTLPDESLPPESLLALHFTRLSPGGATHPTLGDADAAAEQTTGPARQRQEMRDTADSDVQLVSDPERADVLDDDELELSGAAGSEMGSDIALGGSDTGISLASPSDSGLSLEDEPLELGSSISSLEPPEDEDDDVISLEDAEDNLDSPRQLKKDEEFILSSPTDDADDEDSGSHVIALEDSEAFDADAATVVHSSDSALNPTEDVSGFGLDDFDESPLGAPAPAASQRPMAAQPQGASDHAPVWQVVLIIVLFALLVGTIGFIMLKELGGEKPPSNDGASYQDSSEEVTGRL